MFEFLTNPMLSVFASILARLLTPVSAELRVWMNARIVEFYQKAKATPNGWDDIAAGTLCILFGIDTPTGETPQKAAADSAKQKIINDDGTREESFPADLVTGEISGG